MDKIYFDNFKKESFEIGVLCFCEIKEYFLINYGIFYFLGYCVFFNTE